MPKFKLGIAIGLCVLATIGAIFLIITNNKKELIIKLDSNASTGYSWGYSVSNPDIIRIRRKYETDCAPDLVGCGGQDIYEIKPLKEGKVTIHFEYERSWEQEEPLLKATYEIEIKKNLKMKEKHSGSYFKQDK